ncbi:MAG: sulfurtransferase, partial [Gammaproteobacteria bacterium]|nr:sulfurtransferase [Gammaproteobacteria bacterium]
MKNKLLRIILLLLVIAGIAVVVVYRDQLDAAVLESWLQDAGAAAPIVFMLVYIIGTLFFFPGSVLTLLG